MTIKRCERCCNWKRTKEFTTSSEICKTCKENIKLKKLTKDEKFILLVDKRKAEKKARIGLEQELDNVYRSLKKFG